MTLSERDPGDFVDKPVLREDRAVAEDKTSPQWNEENCAFFALPPYLRSAFRND